MHGAKKKLLIICEFFLPHVGGGEKLLGAHAREMVKSGRFEVRVVTSRQRAASAHEVIQPHFEVYRYRWFKLFDHPVARISDLTPHAEWSDLVHTVTYSCAVQSLIVAKKLKKPIIITFFEVLNRQWFSMSSNPLTGLLFYTYELFLLQLPFSFFHAISRHTYKRLIKKVVHSKAVMIYPFVDMPNPSALKVSYKNYHLFFGRAGKTKGLPVLIDAITELKRRGLEPLFILIIAKHPTKERNEIIRYVQSHKLHNVITLDQQPRDQLVSYIQHSRAVIVPSTTEGFGYAAHEASALGTPVIYSSETSLSEVVSLGKQFEVGSSMSLANTIANSDSTSWIKKKLVINNDTSLNEWVKLYNEI